MTLVLLVAGYLALLLALVVALINVSRHRRLHREVVAALAEAEGETTNVKREIRDIERHRQVLGRFLGELAPLTDQLHNRLNPRQIPALLMKIVVRSFEPWQAIVLVRRKRARTEPDRDSRFVVAEIARPEPGLSRGAEVYVGDDELGLVAEAQRVMTRQDIDNAAVEARAKGAGGIRQGFRPDLVAPIVVNEVTMGLIIMSQPVLHPEACRSAMRLISRLGAITFQNVMSYTEMRQTAELDGLTGLYCKQYMTVALAEAIAEAQKNLDTVSIFLFDVDHFKNYNDVNGHVAGDALLKLLASLVQDNIRDTDLFGRVGGEEFLVVFPGTAPADARAVADKIRQKIEDYPFRHRNRQPLGRLSVSGGVAAFPDDALDSANLMREADRALYKAKGDGRNRVLRAEPRFLGETEQEPQPSMLDTWAGERIGEE
ncbi:MAG TPA: GGDEF domain-containing protein [Vicinamibacteria bacterium]|nr:GGDEF domain-containing protein [Vicinamibacteria bacterium]